MCHLPDSQGVISEQPAYIFPHLMLPIRPVVPAFRTPVVQRMPNPFARKDLRQTIGRSAILPLPGSCTNVDVARGQLPQDPWIVEVSEVIHGIVEIKIVVVHPVHEIPDVIHAGHGKASLDHVGMLEERIGGVIGAERRAHGRNRYPGALTIVPNEGNDFLAKVGIKNGLHVASVKWMRAFVIKTESVDGIDAKEFYFSALDKISQRPDHALTFKLRLVACAGRKPENRLTPVPVDNDAHIEAQPRRVPAVIFAFHNVLLASRAGRESMPAQGGWEQWN